MITKRGALGYFFSRYPCASFAAPCNHRCIRMVCDMYIQRDCIQYMHNVVVLFLETTMFLPASQLCRTRTVLKPGWQPHKATPAYWSRLHGILPVENPDLPCAFLLVNYLTSSDALLHVRWIPRTGCTASWRRLSKRAMHGSNQGQELPLVRDPSPQSPRSFQS